MVKLHTSKAIKNPSRVARKWLRAVSALLIAGLITFVLIALFTQKNILSATYEDSDLKGAASFAFDIEFKRDCKDEKDCDPNKPNYENVKVFVFDKTGTQVRVVRADQDGAFKASLPEGDYILLTAKTFKDIRGMPQETVSLKKGKLLKIKVNYGTELK